MFEYEFECYGIACLLWECFINCIILEYECTVKDTYMDGEDGEGLHLGHLNLF